MPPASKTHRRRWLSPFLLIIAIAGFAVLQFGIESLKNPLLTISFEAVTLGVAAAALWSYKSGFR
jgi:hypothetical protein